MALYKNREVTLLGRTDGADVSPTYTVMQKDGSRENVLLNQLELTDEEHNNLTKQHGAYMSNVKKVDRKNLQDLRDGQDRAKIEERQKKEQDKTPTLSVPAQPVKVTPNVSGR